MSVPNLSPDIPDSETHIFLGISLNVSLLKDLYALWFFKKNKFLL